MPGWQSGQAGALTLLVETTLAPLLDEAAFHLFINQFGGIPVHETVGVFEALAVSLLIPHFFLDIFFDVSQIVVLLHLQFYKVSVSFCLSLPAIKVQLLDIGVLLPLFVCSLTV